MSYGRCNRPYVKFIIDGMDFSSRTGLFAIFACLLVCGAAASPLSSRIKGGENAVITEYPYQVSIEHSGHFICAGAIVNDKYVLTTASCADRPKTELTIRAATSLQGKDGIVYDVDKAVKHEKYSNETDSPEIREYNVAVIRIIKSFEFDDKRRPAELFNTSEVIPLGSAGTLTGWGDSGTGSFSLQMQMARLDIVERSTCEEAYAAEGEKLNEGQICAGREGKRLCEGDLGSPLAVEGRLAGLAAWGLNCSSSKPAVFTEIARFRDWIDEHAAY